MVKNSAIMTKIFHCAKWFIYSLLLFNVILFFLDEASIGGIDSLAWIVLLLLFELETSKINKDNSFANKQYVFQFLRIIAYILIAYSTYEYANHKYIQEYGYLDLISSLIWIIVSILIEYEIFYEKKFHKIAIHFIVFFKIGLYLGLFVISFLRGLYGDFLDFYDAVLWIICFFFIELNILGFETKLQKEEKVENVSY